MIVVAAQCVYCTSETQSVSYLAALDPKKELNHNHIITIDNITA